MMAERIKQIPLHIGGEWVETDAEPVTLTSPSTGEAIAAVHQGSSKDVTRAVEAATIALQTLAAMTTFERAALANRVAKF